ncbi:glutamine amidotransferase [uncultured Vibrio sp.]|uniref:glutamine amidotransferase-related protein n=1 Tax=uncultured Vibrio sp. TaxID=114054 RepID=UPI0025F48C68|nr:glutamine amidotransferase [uncultured Vibrio sp.]
MHIHFVIHEAFEAPGAYETWAKHHDYLITYTKLHTGDSFPQNVTEIDVLIVMGGPQNPNTSVEECRYFDSKVEQAFIAKAVHSGKAVIGVCLGSQLIGEALGAPYEHSPEVEVGKFPIMLTDAGVSHELFSHFGRSLDVGHWHNDMPGLTQEAQVIAHSEGCPRQIVAYSELVFGFQCHMELTKEVVALLVKNEDMDRISENHFVETPERLLNHNYDDMNEKLHQFLDKVVARYQRQVPVGKSHQLKSKL